MAKQRIIAIQMANSAGGVGIENKTNLRVDRDPVLLEDAGPEVLVTLRPRTSMEFGDPKTLYLKVPKSNIRYIELESPEAADEREKREKASVGTAAGGDGQTTRRT